MTGPARGFDLAEYHQRLNRAQQLMQRAGLDGLLLTTEPEVRYFTGFLTRFWQSPTRPWFLLVPATAHPIAVIPSIGAELMGQTWIADIRTWRSPDFEDDGVSLLADALKECIGSTGQIGVPMGHETHIRMPMADYQKLTRAMAPGQFRDDANIMADLRMIKSDAEIAKIAVACDIAGRAFARVGEFARAGVGLDEVFRKFQMTCLEEGADWVPYLAGGAGKDGYGDVISPATPAKLCNGDVLMLDTGLVHDGYFCDFDRNFAVGKASAKASDGHCRLMEAVAAGLEAAKPGAIAADVFHAMNKIVSGKIGATSAAGSAGRLGHGLGMQLTEWPSLIAGDETVLRENMVLTLEPGIDMGNNQIMVHEENIVICSDGPKLLSPLAGSELTML